MTSAAESAVWAAGTVNLTEHIPALLRHLLEAINGILVPLAIQLLDRRYYLRPRGRTGLQGASWGASLLGFNHLSLLGWAWHSRKAYYRVGAGALLAGIAAGAMTLVDALVALALGQPFKSGEEAASLIVASLVLGFVVLLLLECWCQVRRGLRIVAVALVLTALVAVGVGLDSEAQPGALLEAVLTTFVVSAIVLAGIEVGLLVFHRLDRLFGGSS